MAENLFGFIGGLILVILTVALLFFMVVIGIFATIKVLFSLLVVLMGITIIYKMVRHLARR